MAGPSTATRTDRSTDTTVRLSKTAGVSTIAICPETGTIGVLLATTGCTSTLTGSSGVFRATGATVGAAGGATVTGFSTAATEALIVGTPVCTVDVSGMKEMLGEHNEYGVVTENNEEALYEGIKMLLDNPDLLAHYKKQAGIRGSMFSTATTVKEVENILIQLSGGC